MYASRFSNFQLLAATLVGVTLSVSAAENTGEPEKNTVTRHALLIGVGQYPQANGRFQSLDGPPNDVELLRGVLTSGYQFKDENIRVLCDGLEEASLPTKENIQRAFDDLTAKVQPGDYVVILFCGHGTQQLNGNPDNDDEPDGLDEVFLARDVYFPEPALDHIPNAVTDDEIGQWLDRLGEKNTSVFVLFDCCHSGTALRGSSDDEKMREVDASTLVNEASLAAAAMLQTKSRGQDKPNDGFETGANVVAIYAAQPHETTPEKKFRGDTGEPVWHGLLSYNVCKVLTESSDLTYRELGNRVQGAYMEMPRFSPTPFVDGKDIDEKFMGGGRRKSPFVLSKPKRGKPTVNAGSINGLSEGSILAVYPPSGEINEDSLLGYVSIESGGIAESQVKPIAYKGKEAADDLSNQARCEVAFVDYGDLRLAVAVDLDVEKGRESVRPLLVAAKEELEKAAATEGAVHRMTTGLDDAQWVVQDRNDRIELIRADCARIRDEDNLPPGAPRFVLDVSDITNSVLSELGRLFRAENLLRLAAMTPMPSDGAGGLPLEFRMLKLKDKNDREGEVISTSGAVPELNEGEFVCWEVINKGREAVDVTLLFIDSQYGITPVFPAINSVGALNRIQPEAKFRTKAIPVTAETVGREYMALIAVKASGPPKDFRILAEEDIAVAQRGGGDDPLTTPLGKLLKSAATLTGEGTRGLGAEEVDECMLGATSWLVQPVKQ